MAQTKQKIKGQFYPLQHSEWLRACKELKSAQKVVLYCIRTLDPCSENRLPEVTEIAKALRLDSSTVSRALKVLGQKGYINWQPDSKDNIEQQVRDRLYTQLGGLVEIATPVGRIEVKAFKDWKAALGQVLAYSAFYREPQKRIHLFGSAAEAGRIVDIQAACLEFDVLVTGEEVAA